MATPGQQAVSYYVDECIEQGRPEMVRMKGHIAKRAADLLDADVPLEEVFAALKEFVRREARTPMALSEISVELKRNERALAHQRPEARRRAKDWIHEHGWPTGVKLARGSHGAQEVYDVLGMERPPHDWPHARPSFDEIADYLATLEEAVA